MYKKIGIVSGMGAAAGVRVLARLIAECQKRGAKADSDFPEIVLHNVPSRGLDEKGIRDSLVFRNELLKSISLLNQCGMDLIIIACNTAHILYDELQGVSKAKILHMVGIACEGLEGKTIGVISSRTTRNACLYEQYLRQHQASAVTVPNEQQSIIDSIIDNAISGKVTPYNERMLWEIMMALKFRGADEIIFGCTELPMVLESGYIDPVEKTIERALTL